MEPAALAQPIPRPDRLSRQSQATLLSSSAAQEQGREGRENETSLLPIVIKADGAELGAVFAELVERAVARG